MNVAVSQYNFIYRNKQQAEFCMQAGLQFHNIKKLRRYHSTQHMKYHGTSCGLLSHTILDFESNLDFFFFFGHDKVKQILKFKMSINQFNADLHLGTWCHFFSIDFNSHFDDVDQPSSTVDAQYPFL